jgi:hypothetical protein
MRPSPYVHALFHGYCFSTLISTDNGGNKCLSACTYAHPSVPGTHFMEQLKVIIHHRTGRPNADIQLFCNFVDHHSSALKNQFPSSFFVLCDCGCGWTTWALCISHTRMTISKYFSPLIHSSSRESIVPILSTMCWSICPPGTPSCRLLLLLGAVLKFLCHVHCFVATLTLTTRSTGLPCSLVTWHLTISSTPTPPALPNFFENIKVWKLLEDPSYICVYWILFIIIIGGVVLSP